MERRTLITLLVAFLSLNAMGFVEKIGSPWHFRFLGLVSISSCLYLLFGKALTSKRRRGESPDPGRPPIQASTPPRQAAMTRVQARYHPLYDRDLD